MTQTELKQAVARAAREYVVVSVAAGAIRPASKAIMRANTAFIYTHFNRN